MPSLLRIKSLTRDRRQLFRVVVKLGSHLIVVPAQDAEKRNLQESPCKISSVSFLLGSVKQATSDIIITCWDFRLN